MTAKIVDGKLIASDSFGPIETGQYHREPTRFRNQITQDGKTGFLPEPDRYHLYYSYACPWAHRTVIMLNLKKLNHVISASNVKPILSEFSWEFGAQEDNANDPISGCQYLYEIYLKSDPKFTGRITVPILFDKKQNIIVNNESSEIIRFFNSEFSAYADPYDYYPEPLREEINEVNNFIYHAINNGVYRCGFAEQQAAYNENYAVLFDALDVVEKRLNGQEYLVGNKFTEADIRLFTTLVRFDAVYYNHFKCNKRRIIDYPNLSRYLQRIYKIPAIKETVNIYEIKQHYFRSHPLINPLGIVPQGPLLPWLEE